MIRKGEDNKRDGLNKLNGASGNFLKKNFPPSVKHLRVLSTVRKYYKNSEKLTGYRWLSICIFVKPHAQQINRML